jgi:2,4-dienoyl-CoA reductase-like NADH-dependent reductase (Old Yellow Enzyme family)
MPNPVGGCTNGGERAVTDRGWRGLRRVVITSRLRWSNKAPIAERPRCETSILVRTIGMITTAKQAVAIVTEGKADMVALARAKGGDFSCIAMFSSGITCSRSYS